MKTSLPRGSRLLRCVLSLSGAIIIGVLVFFAVFIPVQMLFVSPHVAILGDRGNRSAQEIGAALDGFYSSYWWFVALVNPFVCAVMGFSATKFYGRLSCAACLAAIVGGVVLFLFPQSWQLILTSAAYFVAVLAGGYVGTRRKAERT